MNKLAADTLRFIKHYGLLRKGETVVAGISGGPDSVALLHTLHSLRHEIGFDLQAAHVNHRLRTGADRDERFVRNLAADLGVPFHAQRVKVTRTKAHSSLEDAARAVRQKTLFKIAGRLKTRTIALAHTQDDLAETVLMRIIRGTGLEGLQGIAPQRVFGRHNIIRPFLSTSRKDIEHFLARHKLKYRTDPTNKQTIYFRNKIRLKLLPILRQQFNPGITQALVNLAETASTDYDYLYSQTQRHYKRIAPKSPTRPKSLSLKRLKNLPPSIRRMIFRNVIRELKEDPLSFGLQHIHEIEDLIRHRPDSSVVHLPMGISVRKGNDRIIFTIRKA